MYAQDNGESQSMFQFMCDLDRVAVDCQERFDCAERLHQKGTPAYWQAALDPEQLILDVPMPGAVQKLHFIESQGMLCYLTSRPVECYAKTIAWMTSHDFPTANSVICRPPRKGLTTPLFKKRAVRALACGIPET